MPNDTFPKRVEEGRELTVAFLVLLFRLFALVTLVPPLWRAVTG
jgi:hypothetical protein